MRGSAAAAERIQASVRPGIGLPRNASRMPNSSSNAEAIARPPAPPVSTSVPSMSKRTSVGAAMSGFAADVAGARPFRGGFLLERDSLPLIELVEAPLHGAAMEEPLLAAVVADETEAAVSNESLDRACRHPNVSLGSKRCPKSSTYQSSFQRAFLTILRNYGCALKPSQSRRPKTNTSVYRLEARGSAPPAASLQ